MNHNSLNLSEQEIAEHNASLLEKGYYLEVGDDGMVHLLPTEEKKAERKAYIDATLKAQNIRLERMFG